MVRVKGASNLRSDEAILEMSNFYKREREEIRMSNSPECTGVSGEALQLLQCFFYSKSRKNLHQYYKTCTLFCMSTTDYDND